MKTTLNERFGFNGSRNRLGTEQALGKICSEFRRMLKYFRV